MERTECFGEYDVTTCDFQKYNFKCQHFASGKLPKGSCLQCHCWMKCKDRPNKYAVGRLELLKETGQLEILKRRREMENQSCWYHLSKKKSARHKSWEMYINLH